MIRAIAATLSHRAALAGVTYNYRFGKCEVTNAQYTEFLLSVAATDTNGLYETGMGGPLGGITKRPSLPLPPVDDGDSRTRAILLAKRHLWL